MGNKLNILFVSSGNSAAGITRVVKNQGLSLIKYGHSVEFYTIKGRGWRGYLKSILPLRKFIRAKEFDVIHAHYSLSGFVCSLAFSNIPIVVSLMGSDIMGGRIMLPFINLFSMLFWKKIIIKSKRLKENAGIKKAQIIPNGLDLNHFKPMDKIACKRQIEWDTNKRHILFASNPSRPEKNYVLAVGAIDFLNTAEIELHALNNVARNLVPVWINASDVILLSSHWEGSPNIIKEAMACNCPIVSTDVGDVQEVIGKTEGCYISSFDPEDVAEKLIQAIRFGKRTTGRESIQHLDEKIIALKLEDLYNSI